MKLSYVQFETLFFVRQTKGHATFETICTSLPQFAEPVLLSETNNLLSHRCLMLQDKKLKITETGRATLEQYRVKCAVILAAGFGSRMLPATENSPRPMVTVNGTSFIETQIDALLRAGITDITVVRGHKAEKFDALRAKYPTVVYRENTEYTTRNNIVSGYIAREKLNRAYLLEGDVFISNPLVIRPFEYRSHYCGVAVEATDDWHFQLLNGQITGLKQGSDQPSNQYIGISFWTSGYARMLALDLEDAIKDSSNNQCFIEDVHFELFRQRYFLFMRSLNGTDVVEVDTYQELQALDSSYKQCLVATNYST